MSACAFVKTRHNRIVRAKGRARDRWQLEHGYIDIAHMTQMAREHFAATGGKHERKAPESLGPAAY